MSLLPSIVQTPRDLPVCWHGHPCVDYSPFEADGTNALFWAEDHPGTIVAFAVVFVLLVIAASSIVFVRMRTRRRVA